MRREIILVLVFVLAALIGYKLLRSVPSLLHTPLMSRMNALSGVTILGAITATAGAVALGSKALGFLGIVCAAVNVAAGFSVTDRMLRMFKHSDTEGQGDE